MPDTKREVRIRTLLDSFGSRRSFKAEIRPKDQVTPHADTLNTPSLAQTIPDDILSKIFEVVLSFRSASRKQTLTNCTLVCRSWSLISSLALLRYVHFAIGRLPDGAGRRSRAMASLRSLFGRKPRLQAAISAGRTLPTCMATCRMLSQFATKALCTPRLVGTIQNLHICAETIDFIALQHTVMQLVHLDRLRLHIHTFTALEWKVWSPPNGRDINTLILCFMDTITAGEIPDSSTSHLKPGLLDVLLWFSTCENLDVDGASGCLINLFESKSKVAVQHLTFHSVDTSICLNPAFVERVFDFRTLKSLYLRLFTWELPNMDAFLACHGTALREMRLVVYAGVPPPLTGLHESWREKEVAPEITRYIAEEPGPSFPTSCPKLRTVYLTLRADLTYINVNFMCHKVWARYLKALTADGTALRRLYPSLSLTHGWYKEEAVTEGDIIETESSVLKAFLSSLDWSLLDGRSESASPPFTTSHGPPSSSTALHQEQLRKLDLKSISVVIANFDEAENGWVSLPEAECAELVWPKVSLRTRKILTFEPFHLTQRDLSSCKTLGSQPSVLWH